ncbi:miniconductance mechanosensitive channel MscM [Candidatus Erwinia haradaeae]|uniref:Miniconductance mechanosensitive channel MscM n=1 Tax=Candidatus Erwinia haradaeae TaxID=1922217 RepID=A0A451DI88_9GAMM|nr:miniconductance mechanosensitive channel MscM [Candidatus Erwinia haradaeae]VFP86331.1 Miniconductance mechanosensitive channel MscM [Candidatus Erwinia haradaeae]
MLYLLTIVIGWIYFQPVYGSNVQSTLQIIKKYEEPETEKNTIYQETNNHSILSTSLYWLKEYQKSFNRAQDYQKSIDNFPKKSREFRQEMNRQILSFQSVLTNMSIAELEKEIQKLSKQIVKEYHQSKIENDRAQDINDSLSFLPDRQSVLRHSLHNLSRQLYVSPSQTTTIEQLKQIQYQAELSAHKAKLNELILEQLSANNRQKLAHMQAEIHQRTAAALTQRLQRLRNQLHSQQQNSIERALEINEKLVRFHSKIPNSITEQFHINRELSLELKRQAFRMDLVASQQRTAIIQTMQIRQALSTICEQSQWLGASNALGEALRALVARLPKIPKPQQLGSEMAELRAKRLYYADLLEQTALAIHTNHHFLNKDYEHLLTAQFQNQYKLLTSLLSGCDALTLELTKLNVSNSQLVDALNEVKDATHRYLFWTADVSALHITYPVELLKDLQQFLSLDTLGQLSRAMVMMVTSRDTFLPIFLATIFVAFTVSSRHHFRAFLNRSASKVGKVTQDKFNLTIRTVFWSILVAMPLPVLWEALGYGLQHAWPYSIAVAIGDGVSASVPLLWGFMICNVFACQKGLFIVHFRWPKYRVDLAMRFYTLCIGVVVPLIMMSIAFATLSDRKFYPTLGRLCFICICGVLSLVTVSLKRAGISLYIDNKENYSTVINKILWNIMIIIPVIASLAACIGYLETSQALLARLETSLAIGFLCLVIYHVIRRWMLIQRRRIAFDRARTRRAEILSQRIRTGEKLTSYQHITDNIDTEDTTINLDAISAQSLQLARSLLTWIALLSMIALWSEIHAAFSFLANIRLWDVSTTIKGVDTIRAITLGSVMNAILVLIVTTQLVRNMPALLELALLQHLSLTPGTGYAIITSTKYLIIVFGSLTAFSLIGIDWSKLQWLVAGLSLGLGFGLQEIFANFISGLIILFEKPIRIGDTVTIRDLTGTITRINTRATTITDWDRKEIIVPNRSFITEQLINWSLSDSVTRVVLSIPVSLTANSEKVTKVLLDAAQHCRFVLKIPPPEAFIVNVKQGIQLFELRVHAAEMEDRMPLRHDLHQLVLLGFKASGLEIPCPTFQIRMDLSVSQSSQCKR